MAGRTRRDSPQVSTARRSPDELFCLTFEARPTRRSDEYGEVGGAFVVGWFDVDDLATAEKRMRELIRRESWRVVKFDSWSVQTKAGYVERASADDEIDYPPICDQAFADGAAVIFNTWPVDDVPD